MADCKYLPVFASLMKEAGFLMLFGFLRSFASEKHSASYNLIFIILSQFFIHGTTYLTYLCTCSLYQQMTY